MPSANPPKGKILLRYADAEGASKGLRLKPRKAAMTRSLPCLAARCCFGTVCRSPVTTWPGSGDTRLFAKVVFSAVPASARWLPSRTSGEESIRRSQGATSISWSDGLAMRVAPPAIAANGNVALATLRGIALPTLAGLEVRTIVD